MPNVDNEYKDDKKKNKIKLIIIFISVFLVLFCGVYFGIGLYNQYIVNRPIETTADPETSVNLDVIKKVKNPIDFDSLIKSNSDIYAYIKIKDTNVDYPIVQSTVDDEFYLKHSAKDKSWSDSGAIYTEAHNTRTFNDKITVIYGHNGYGDTFFTTLHKFENQKFFDTHPYFYIYTPTKKLTYQIMSAFKYDDRHILNSFNFADTRVLAAFQKQLRNPSSAVKNVRQELQTDITVDSRIVILSTCVTNQRSSRYLVSGVLVKNEQTY